MDKNEQVELINNMVQENRTSVRNHKLALAIFSLVLGMGKLYMAANQYFHPFSVSPHVELINYFTYDIVAWAELASAISFFALFYYISPMDTPVKFNPNQPQIESPESTSRKQTALFIGSTLTLPALFIFYVYADLKWIVLLWFSLGNLVLALLLFFVVFSTSGIENEILQLHNYTYNYKKV
eukprot:TRINITY_DN5028_c0_g1_i2.p1 TRINITY_DN5028_c0_g1~~TRINITY_DN5028_c0_g1_i2.p1  ORF type:complete len:201 (+),score=8.78 TRINITY_DN5028_c0_g1_i2:59-604(+)